MSNHYSRSGSISLPLDTLRTSLPSDVTVPKLLPGSTGFHRLHVHHLTTVIPVIHTVLNKPDSAYTTNLN